MTQFTIYAQTNGMAWNATNGWDSVPAGGGTDYTNPQNGADTYICILNGKHVKQNVNVVVDQIRESGTGYLDVSGVRTINATGGIDYAGNSANGMLRLTAGEAITISNGTVMNSGGGRAIVGLQSIININNYGNTACHALNGYAVYNGQSNGVNNISGNLIADGGRACYFYDDLGTQTADAATITGSAGATGVQTSSRPALGPGPAQRFVQAPVH